MARIAKSLAKLREQVNARYPKRSKISDGWLGDAAHRARKSDHNPDSDGVVLALDLTNDPAHGFYSNTLAEVLRVNKDPRISYVISNGRIFSSSVQPWKWRAYTGSNRHDRHVHVSVVSNPKRYDDARAWVIEAKATPYRHKNIVATTFSSKESGAKGAYGDWIDSKILGVSLPARFKGPRPKVRIFANGKSVVADIVDVGPWNIDDPYWETKARPQAETGTDLYKGRKTNKAGIDLTPATARALGLPEQWLGKVDWEFA